MNTDMTMEHTTEKPMITNDIYFSTTYLRDMVWDMEYDNWETWWVSPLYIGYDDYISRVEEIVDNFNELHDECYLDFDRTYYECREDMIEKTKITITKVLELAPSEDEDCKSPEKCYCPACIDDAIEKKMLKMEREGEGGEIFNDIKKAFYHLKMERESKEDFSEEARANVRNGIWYLEADDNYDIDIFCKKEYEDYMVHTIEGMVEEFNDKNNESHVGMDWDIQDDYQNDADIHITFSISKWSAGDSEDESEDEFEEYDENKKYICCDCKRDFTDECDDRSSFKNDRKDRKYICMDCFQLEEEVGF